MFPLVLVMTAVAASPPSLPLPTAGEDEIVVIARKMRMIKVDIQAPRRNGQLVLARCRVTRPSGYAELDTIPCDAAQVCIAEHPATRPALEQCVERASVARIDAVAARWRAAREGAQ